MDKRARERDKDKGLPPSKRKAKGKLVEGQITTDQIQGPGPAPPPPTPTESIPTCKTLTQKTGQAFLETPDQTPPPTTSRSSAGYWTRPGSAPDPGGGSWCALMGPEAQRRLLSSWPVGGCPTAWGSRFPSTRRRSTGTIPETAWAPAYNADGQPRDGADVAETRRPAGPDRLAQGYAGQPCAESGPIRAPSYASRTSGATGPPPSPPARGWVSSPISRCATGCGPAARGPYPLRQGHRA